MPLPLTIACFSKIQIDFTFLVPAYPGSPRKRAVKRVCVCVCKMCHCNSLFLASVKSRLVLPFGYWLTWVIPDKGPLNECVCVSGVIFIDRSLAAGDVVCLTRLRQTVMMTWTTSLLTMVSVLDYVLVACIVLCIDCLDTVDWPTGRAKCDAVVSCGCSLCDPIYVKSSRGEGQLNKNLICIHR